MNTARCLACGRWYPSQALYCGQCKRKLFHLKTWHYTAAVLAISVVGALVAVPLAASRLAQRSIEVEVESIGSLKLDGRRAPLTDLAEQLKPTVPVIVQVSNKGPLPIEIAEASGEVQVSGIRLAEFQLDTARTGPVAVSPGGSRRAEIGVRPSAALLDLVAKPPLRPSVSVTVIVVCRVDILFLHPRFRIQRRSELELLPGL